MAAPHETDGLDMRALQAGEDRALDRLMTRWQAPLRGFLFRYTQDEFDAHDLAQETFIRVYRNRERFLENARFSTWLFAIALNLARDRARKKERRPTQSLDTIEEPAEFRNAQSDAEKEERLAAVRAAIADLPEDLRAVVILFEYENLSHAEIAAVVGASAKAVETRLYRARQLLKKILERHLVW